MKKKRASYSLKALSVAPAAKVPYAPRKKIYTASKIATTSATHETTPAARISALSCGAKKAREVRGWDRVVEWVF